MSNEKTVVTIELTCIEAPDGNEEAEERSEETRNMYDVARAILKRNDGHLDTSEHYDSGPQTTFGDAYARVPANRLFRVLDQFDKKDVGYDNIDVPRDAAHLLVLLRRRYPRNCGVSVNESGY